MLNSPLFFNSYLVVVPTIGQKYVKNNFVNTPRIGIIGGGQLAKMIAISAIKYGCHIVILEKTQKSPAENLAAEIIYGDWDDPKNLLELANKVDVITLENEFVDANSLKVLEDTGHSLYPSSTTIDLVQDKLNQKKTLEDAGIPVVAFTAIESRVEITRHADKLGWPIILKARRNAYDGKGNLTLNSEDDITSAWTKLNGDNRKLYIEGFCNFKSELAVMITRDVNGKIITYPVVESIQKNHICHIVRAPASIDNQLAEKAIELAVRAVKAIDGIGTIGVEMFCTKDNKIIINEMAPRVHNSGHYTIEACETSQFENHVRTILGLPLGSSRMIAPGAVMINMLGNKEGNGSPTGIEKALAINGAYVHVYGKTTTNIGRKMGHVTALGSSVAEAESLATKAASSINFGEQK